MNKIIYSLTLAAAIIASPMLAHADVSLSVSIAPPPLPVYEQPPVPGDGYIWTPGYWSWNDADNDYYWVPGTWVTAPFEGALWTPGYWGWGNGNYAWHGGYWGTHIGYYGGVNYGFGYVGVGYQGGYWNHGVFNYNRSVNNVGNAHIANVYNTRIENAPTSRVSYNGGRGGVALQPTRAEISIASMPHNTQTAPQVQHEQAARGNQALRASVNHGTPPVAATPEPGAFNAHTIVAVRPMPPASPVREVMKQQPHAEQRPQNAPHPAGPHEEERHEK